MLQAGAAALLTLAFSWLAGSWCARRWLAAGAVPAGLRHADMAAAVLALAATLAAMWTATAMMGGLPLAEAGSMLWTMLTSTAHGHAGCVLLLLLLLLLAVRWTGRGDAVVLALLLAFAAVRASMGHAGEGGYGTVPHVAETVHLLAIAVWTGVVLVSGWHVLAPGMVPQAAQGYLERMSLGATLAVVALGATGVYSAWQRLGGAAPLVHTAYGWTLLAKVALVAVALALGAWNKYFGLPAASPTAAGIGTVRRVLRIESVLLLGAVAAAALLTVQQPPAAM
ncbi:putative copper resistance protein D [Pseudoduganella flava]|uniref:Putative copper resistance protein D n=1 Tax=Pseudoduganella flava TaxID=871742 RepID=A0A562PKT8_9BURK|nr:putative copper resistance protein D [Pseudoduganella flava]